VPVYDTLSVMWGRCRVWL